jgi:small-conductance mechanosensitive channel
MSSMLDIERRLEDAERNIAVLQAALMGTQLNLSILTATPQANPVQAAEQEQSTIEEPVTDPDA